MRSLPFLLIACLALALMAGEADAESESAKEPEWTYDIGSGNDLVAISADGEYIAVAGNYKVFLFNKDNSTPLWSYATDEENNYFRSLAISADGEYITAGTGYYDYTNNSWKGRVYLFEKDSDTPLWIYDAEEQVHLTAISADGEYIAAGTYDELLFFSKDSNEPLWSWTTAHEEHVHSIAISADGEYIVAGDDNELLFFSKDSNEPLWSWTTTFFVTRVDISADGEYVAASTDIGDLYLFDKDNSTPLWSYSTGGYVRSVAISADGEYIAVSGDNKKVYLFNKDSSTPLWSYDTGVLVYSIAISADGEYIVTGDDDRLLFFSKDSNEPLWIYDNEEQVYSVSMSAGGEYIVTSNVNSNKVHLFNKDAPPIANIDSIEPASIRFDEGVTFTGSGTDRDGTIVAYEWTSDIDGFLSDEKEFSKIGFTAASGSYSNGDIFICNNGQTNCYQTISFRVQDNDGDWSSWSTTEMWVYPNKPPFATIDSIAPSPAEKGWTVSFSGTGSDSDGTIVGYLWESSIDGELSTETNFNSNSLSPGHHSITFRVQDSDGDWNDANLESLWIYALPVAIAGDDITVNSGDDNVKFRGQGTDEDGNIALYEWDFDGDGIYDWSSSENGRTIYIYNNEGTFTAVLRVTDNDSFTSTDHLVVTIGRSSGEDDDDDSLLAPSLAASVAAVAVIALRRRY